MANGDAKALTKVLLRELEEQMPVEDRSRSTFHYKDVEHWLPTFRRLGFVVLTDILAAANISVTQALAWFADDLFASTGMQVEEPSSLINRNNPRIMSVGIVKEPQAGLHLGNFAWQMREAVRLTGVFQALYGTSKETAVYSSLDSIGFWRNWGLDAKYRTKAPWPHIDVGLGLEAENASGVPQAQSLVNLVAADARTGGFMCAPGAHLVHKEILAILKPSKKKHYLPFNEKLPEVQALLQKNELHWSRVAAPAGSLVLWDSRLPHSNVSSRPSLGAPSLSHGNMLRVVSYVNLVPRSTYSEEERERIDQQREKFLREGKLTNHHVHPDRAQAQYPAYPRHATFREMKSSALPLDKMVMEFGHLC